MAADTARARGRHGSGDSRSRVEGKEMGACEHSAHPQERGSGRKQWAVVSPPGQARHVLAPKCDSCTQTLLQQAECV